MNLSQIHLPKVTTSSTKIYSTKSRNSNASSASMLLHLHEYSNNTLVDGSDVHLKLRIAYQGVPGAHGEAAVMKAYPNCERVQCHRFEDTLRAVEVVRAEEAVIPIENSIGGSIDGNYDLLLRHSLHVVGEIHLFVDHCLLALPGVSKQQLTCVLSHPQALTQCEMSLKMLGVDTRPVENTAYAAQIVASSGARENGAIASARAAELYGLQILAHKFQDRSNSVTRFLKLARKPIFPTVDIHAKTSIALILKEGPQELHRALSLFAHCEIRISKIESRPLEKHSIKAVNGFKYGSRMYFKYVYFIDFEASVQDLRAQYVIDHLQEMASEVRVLGSYPIDVAAC